MQRDLVERARKGDHDAFAELAGAAISRLDATAWLMIRDADRATDAVQNALVRAWRDLPALRDPDRFDAWLHRLLVNACIDELRRVKKHRLDLDITDVGMGLSARAEVRAALGGLGYGPDEVRDVLAMLGDTADVSVEDMLRDALRLLAVNA